MSREPEVGLKVRELRDSFESVESESVSNIFSLSFDLWEQVAERVSRKATHKLLLNPAFRGRRLPSLRRGEWIETSGPATSMPRGRLPSLRRGEWIETGSCYVGGHAVDRSSPLASAGGVD